MHAASASAAEAARLLPPLVVFAQAEPFDHNPGELSPPTPPTPHPAPRPRPESARFAPHPRRPAAALGPPDRAASPHALPWLAASPHALAETAFLDELSLLAAHVSAGRRPPRWVPLGLWSGGERIVYCDASGAPHQALTVNQLAPSVALHSWPPPSPSPTFSPPRLSSSSHGNTPHPS